MKRICIFCETWDNGGIEAYLTNMLEHMDLDEMSIDLVVTVLRESIYSQRVKALGVEIIQLSGKLYSSKNYMQFERILRTRHYDVAYFNVFQALSLVYLYIAHRRGIPKLIAHSHNTDIRPGVLKPLKVMIHKVASSILSGYATELWACSNMAAEFLFSEEARREKGCRFIPNGIDLQKFSYDRFAREKVREQMQIGDALLVGHIGRLCWQKNQVFLLDVFRELHKKCKNTRLVLVGIGELNAKLKEKAEALGIQDKVIFYGSTNSPESLLSAMDVFVFPSLFEGLGISAVEAQTSGLVTICSENVPNEAAVSSLFVRKNISDGAESWADTILRYANIPFDRAGAVISPEFDINEVSAMIRDRFDTEECENE